MKTKKILSVLSILVVLSLVLSACGVAGKHDKLVQLYQKAVMAKSTANACFSTNGSMVRDTFKVYTTYLNADSAEVQAWKADKLAAAEAKLAEAKNASKKAGDDLNAAVETGGTPSDIAAGFALQISAYTEAPWNHIPQELALSLNDTIAEAYSTVFGCVTDWNSAVMEYNVERARIAGLVNSGRIVGDAANALGVTELPSQLPYYEPPEDSAPIGTDFLQDAVPTQPQ